MKKKSINHIILGTTLLLSLSLVSCNKKEPRPSESSIESAESLTSSEESIPVEESSLEESILDSEEESMIESEEESLEPVSEEESALPSEEESIPVEESSEEETMSIEESDEESESVDNGEVTGVKLNQTSLNLAINESATLIATVLPSTANNTSVRWSSSDSDVAVVNSEGKVTGVSIGDAIITVTTVEGEFTATCEVNVSDKAIPVTGISLNYETASLYIGDTLSLTASIEPYNATNQNITWSSTFDEIASVENGIVSGLQEGVATITAETEDGGFKASCIFSVSEKPNEDDYDPDTADENIYLITEDTLSKGEYDEIEDEYTFAIKKNYKQVYVNAPNETIIVELCGVTLENDENSPIYVASADKIELSVKKSTVNYINDTRSVYEEDDDTQGKGAIYVADGDLKIKSTGILNINAGYYNGIHGKDDVKIQKATINITAPHHGIKGNDSVTISSGTINISCGGDGIRTENSDISSKGNQRGDITINGGTITVNSWGDSIVASHDVIFEESDPITYTSRTNEYSSYEGETIDTSESTFYIKMNSALYSNGSYTYAAYINGEWYKAAFKTSQTQQGGGPGRGPGGGSTYYIYEIEKPESAINFTLYRFSGSDVTSFSTSSYEAVSDLKAFNTEYDTIMVSYIRSGKISFGSWSNYQASSNGADISAKGIKAENEIYLKSGTFDIKAYDDAIHANNDGSLENGTTPLGNVYISGGTYELYAADDAIHADYNLEISGGTINISSAYEGLEGNVITISGGETYVVGTDDGINACSGKSAPAITVTGGYLDVMVPSSGDTDGIDSNGTYTQSGGVVIIKGPGNASGNNFGAAALDTDSTVKITSGTLIVFGGIEQTPSSSVTKTLCSSSTVSAGSHTVSFSSESFTTTLKYSTNGCVVYSSLGSATLK